MAHSTAASAASPTELEWLGEEQALGKAANLGRQGIAYETAITATVSRGAVATASTEQQKNLPTAPEEIL